MEAQRQREENRQLCEGAGRSFVSSGGLGFGKLAFEVDFNIGPVHTATESTGLQWAGVGGARDRNLETQEMNPTSL